MNTGVRFLLAVFIVSISYGFICDHEEWGFWGHRRINRMAVFTLPPELIPFYKQNIEYITEHAIDPDKRRYATKFEAVRHYIDIDHWGTYPFPDLPRDFNEALLKYTGVYCIDSAGDTTSVSMDTIQDQPYLLLETKKGVYRTHYHDNYKPFFYNKILPLYYEDDWVINCEMLDSLFGLSPGTIDCQRTFALDHFTKYGIVPYYLPVIQNQLTEAFLEKNISRILRLSAEIGHYIGDAHVPLHTTENYNGQLTNQVGIHAFWESRIPELFADKEYDYFVGKAEYISEPKPYFWDIVLESHLLVDSVLLIEKELSETFPGDKQYCYEERLGRTIRTQCRDYAAAYQKRMGGMVEERMQKTILSVGSCWYTAWVDAGQPDLTNLDEYKLSPDELRELERLNAEVQQGESKGRVHE